MLTWIVRNTITCTIVRNNKGRKSINAAGIRSKKQLQTFSFCFSPMLSLNSHTLALLASKRKARVLCKIDILLLYISAGSGTNGQQTKTVWGELEKIPTRLMEKLRHSHSGRPTSGFFFPCYDTLLKKVNNHRQHGWKLKLANRDSNQKRSFLHLHTSMWGKFSTNI